MLKGRKRTGGGARSADPNKFRKDAAIFDEALKREPENARYVYYLAQSWRDAGDFEKALAAYAHRASMGDGTKRFTSSTRSAA